MSTPIRVSKNDIFVYFGVRFSQMRKECQFFRPKKYTLPFNITRYHAKSGFEGK